MKPSSEWNRWARGGVHIQCWHTSRKAFQRGWWLWCSIRQCLCHHSSWAVPVHSVEKIRALVPEHVLQNFVLHHLSLIPVCLLHPYPLSLAPAGLHSFLPALFIETYPGGLADSTCLPFRITRFLLHVGLSSGLGVFQTMPALSMPSVAWCEGWTLHQCRPIFDTPELSGNVS